MRTWFPAALLFVASTALAQTPQTYADLSVAIIADQTVDANQPINFQVDVTNLGPDVALDTQVYASANFPGGCNGTLAGNIAPGSHVLVPCSIFAPGATTDVVLTARAVSGTADPNSSNSTATRTIHAISGMDLGIHLVVPAIVTPGVPFAIGIFYGNNAAITATGVTVSVGIPSTVHVTAMPDYCAPSAGGLTCTIGTVAPRKLPGFAGPDFAITAVADDASNGIALQFTADIKANEPEAFVSNNHDVASTRVSRTFYVTDTADSLAGAIDQANLSCTDNYPCKIAFRLGTPPQSGYFTLKPHRALPKITAKSLFIDGSTQTALSGDTNPNGPEIFIDGSENEWEDAVVFDEPCGGEIAFVSIGNFRNAAVSMFGADPGGTNPCAGEYPGAAYVHDSYLGVDPTGTTAAPNGRGVVISQKVYGGAVNHNIISGNHRSGVWIGMAHTSTVYVNKIGLDIHNQPLPNGASGVFAGPLVTDLNIESNTIAFNHDFGISTDRRAVGVYIAANSIYSNLQLGIDIGLDGPTPDIDIPAPTIVSAQYDPAADKTIIVLSAHEPVLEYRPYASLYASDAPDPSGYGEGQFFLDQREFDPKLGGETVSVKGDWRGKWVTATVTRNDFVLSVVGHATTSEFSRAVKVE
jgi:hypothetical protein